MGTLRDIGDWFQEKAIDPVKDIIGETGIGTALGGIASVGLAPFTGGASLSMLPYMMAGGGMIGGGMEEEGNTIGNILGGGLMGYGAGSIGAGLAGISVPSIFGAGAGAGDLFGYTPPGTTTPYWYGAGSTSPVAMGGILDNLGQLIGGQKLGGGIDIGKIIQSVLGGGGQQPTGGVGGVGGARGISGAGGVSGAGAGGVGGFTPTTEYRIPDPAQYPQAPELFQQAMEFGKEEFPGAYGAREEALGFGPGFWEKYQPTSIEQALASQYISGTMPDIERRIRHQASLSGLEGTVLPMREIGRARGELGLGIGEFLANLGQRRGELEYTSKMGLDPYSTISPYLKTDIGQQTLQEQSDYQNRLLRSQMDYVREVGQEQEKAAKAGTLWGLGGAGIGGMLGYPQAGKTIGELIGALTGQSNLPINIEDIYSMIGNIFPQKQASTTGQVELADVLKQVTQSSNLWGGNLWS